jgi:hypothetical protein
VLSKPYPPNLSIQKQALSRPLGITPNRDAYVTHIVGRWQGLLGDDLKLKIPSGLCGASLKADPGQLDPADANLPLCPRCLQRDTRHLRRRRPRRNARPPLQTVSPYQLPDWPVRLFRLIAIITTIAAVAVVIALAIIVISGPVETPATPGPPANVIEASATQQLHHVAGARPGRTPAEWIR